jgi:hypothetical protein
MQGARTQDRALPGSISYIPVVGDRPFPSKLHRRHEPARGPDAWAHPFRRPDAEPTSPFALVHHHHVPNSANVSGGSTTAESERVDAVDHHLTRGPTPLLAIKWLGNTGAHDAIGATRKDALDAFQILQEVLQKLYARSDTGKLVAAVNAKKGPVKARRKRTA